MLKALSVLMPLIVLRYSIRLSAVFKRGGNTGCALACGENNQQTIFIFEQFYIIGQ